MNNLTLFFVYLINICAYSQCPSCSIASLNLVINGDFESGNSGFYSDYTFVSPQNTSAAQYCIITNAADWNSSWHIPFDHTSGNGKMMIVNGSGNPNTVLWRQTISVSSNTNYYFSVWLSNAYPASPAILQFMINGTTIGAAFQSNLSVGKWVNYYASWNSGSTNSAEIIILNQNNTLGGNDFGIDDIFFTECKPLELHMKLGNDTTICSSSYTLSAGKGFEDYLWNTGEKTQDITISKSGHYSVKVHQNGCETIDTIYVTLVDEFHEKILGNDTTLCVGDFLQLNASKGNNYTYLWQDGSISSEYLVNANGLYYVTIKDQHCSYGDSILVRFIPKPRIVLGADTTICQGDTVWLKAGQKGQLIQWNTGQKDTTIAITIAGKYSVSINDSGCVNESGIVINMYLPPRAYIDSAYHLCNDNGIDSLIINVDKSLTCTWNPGNITSNQITIKTPGAWRCLIKNKTGCISNDSFIVRNICEPIVYVPNAFKPDSDRVNDLFKPVGTYIYKMHFDIYNRWGEKIFSLNNHSQGWDGTYNGLPCPQDVYIWILQYEGYGSNNHKILNHLSGNVTLLR